MILFDNRSRNKYNKKEIYEQALNYFFLLQGYCDINLNELKNNKIRLVCFFFKLRCLIVTECVINV